jgi:hypothetical protein
MDDAQFTFTYVFLVDTVGLTVDSRTTVYRITDICTRGFCEALVSTLIVKLRTCQ